MASILVVDDDPGVLRLLEMVLRKDGLEVLLATSCSASRQAVPRVCGVRALPGQQSRQGVLRLSPCRPTRASGMRRSLSTCGGVGLEGERASAGWSIPPATAPLPLEHGNRGPASSLERSATARVLSAGVVVRLDGPGQRVQVVVSESSRKFSHIRQRLTAMPLLLKRPCVPHKSLLAAAAPGGGA
jgi:hypothetical protein